MSQLAFLFAGQGAQYVGMGRALYDEHALVREAFAEASDVLGFDLAQLCFDGPEDQLNETANTQPAVLTLGYACWRLIAEAGVSATAMAGLSLGEWTAHVAAGSLSFPDAVSLVRQRGQFMQEAVPLGVGAMAAILGLDSESVAAACAEAANGEVVSPANYNCPGQVVIAGHKAAVERAAALCRERGARRAVLLPVSAPFHCALMEPAAARLAPLLEAANVADAAVPVWANALAAPVQAAADVRSSLLQQVASPVRFEETLARLLAGGCRTFVELGPGKTLSGFVRKLDKTAAVYHVEDPESLAATLAALGGNG